MWVPSPKGDPEGDAPRPILFRAASASIHFPKNRIGEDWVLPDLIEKDDSQASRFRRAAATSLEVAESKVIPLERR